MALAVEPSSGRAPAEADHLLSLPVAATPYAGLYLADSGAHTVRFGARMHLDPGLAV